MNQSNSSHPSAEDDLLWQSVRYILREMQEKELAQFEAQLADDQAARESVAQAVRLVSALQDAQPAHELLPQTSRRTVSRLRAAGGKLRVRSIVALVACSCLAALSLSFFPPRPGRVQEAPVANTQSDNGAGGGHLVAIWSDRLAESDSENALDSPNLERGDAIVSAEADDATSPEGADGAASDSAAASDPTRNDEFRLPGWLIAAVSLGSEQ
jgi:hypothetical protein